MINFKLGQFKITFVVTISAILFIFLYLAYSSWHFQQQYVHDQSEDLNEFTNRSISRINANPHRFIGENKEIIGTQRMKLVDDFNELSKILPADVGKDDLVYEQINVIFLKFKGFFSVSDVTLVYPVDVDGIQFYAYAYTSNAINDARLNTHLSEGLQPAIFLAIALISILLIVQLMQINNVGKMVNQLANWADTLSTTKKFQPPPKLASGGINFLAHTMSNSLNTFSDILEKEHTFARFSSHELRTQVAVLSVNMEILEVIMKDLSSEERKVLNRMLIAIEDMKYQTEALLWLGKATENELEFSDCNIVEILNKAIELNNHIIENKDVKIIMSGGDLTIFSQETLLQIALNNLIRNAFQNTNEGLVHIAVARSSFSIVNTNMGSPGNSKNLDGFGIGLVLVQRIVEKIDLVYNVENFDKGRSVELSLANVIIDVSEK
ncbi:HAMP domain-containing histidine kinase [Psychrosphaera sp. B3R10]|uniref:sensor histidine kinase n=1 Tax=unclassified Psychrosphaera TaxID=2641570 RepID=UPI001C09F69A|nr:MULTISPECIES: HAMP domain-containing sensor histidine kinase [unclassified Psychrosphaera]MBU2883595.1 HAMP domain-containing histidine kinase [Psychrosphaera sp. I2R16]MBU2989773.1 HAMP domain-containing histidine kinase [Psychrosphaera sp. B3R10]